MGSVLIAVMERACGGGDHDYSVSARGVTGLGLGLIDLGEGLRKWGFTLDWVLSGKQG